MLTNQYPIGSISHATMRNQDLIPVFMDELENLNPSAYQAILSEYDLNEDMFWPDDDHDFWSSDDADYLLESLFDALDECAAPYMYFGANEGDGSDYGFWVYLDVQEMFEGLQVSDTSEIPSDYSGEVLHINDHGNATLYIARKGEIVEEVWAIV